MSEPFSVQVEALPAASTSVSLQRVRYEPGVELSEQPIDGPRLLLVDSGTLSLEFARAGASLFTANSPPEEAIALTPGEAHQVFAGDIVLVPAGVPLQLGNDSTEPVAWLQFQAETPPTICVCGEDLTGSTTTLLSSQTLETPIAAPATLSLVAEELGPQQAAPAPAPGVVQVAAAVDDTASLSTGGDGLPRNTSTEVVLIYIVKLGALPTT